MTGNGKVVHPSLQRPTPLTIGGSETTFSICETLIKLHNPGMWSLFHERVHLGLATGWWVISLLLWIIHLTGHSLVTLLGLTCHTSVPKKVDFGMWDPFLGYSSAFFFWSFRGLCISQARCSSLENRFFRGLFGWWISSIFSFCLVIAQICWVPLTERAHKVCSFSLWP